MYLSNIKLWNFRKYGSESEMDLSEPNLNLDFTKGLNVLIGENDSGKTAILDAVKLVLKTHSYDWIRVTQDDFFIEKERFRIELRFDDLSLDEAKNFTEWLGWDGEGTDATPFLRVIYDVSRNISDNYIIPSDVRAGVDENGYQLTAEAREYLKTTYLKPLRDAQSELVPRKNSRLAQILLGHEAFKGREANHLLMDLFRDFNVSVENYFEGTDNDGTALEGDQLKGKELKDEIDTFIKAFYDQTKESNFGVVGTNLKNILEKLELSIKDDVNPGLGTLNRLFMASELLHLKKRNWSGLRLGLVEEIEAHLHPQAQMQVIEALQKEENVQLILSTHSPSLGSKIKLENLILCHGSDAYPLGTDYTKLEAGDYVFLERFLDTTKANLFFAKSVIMIEGWAEEILLPSLAKKMKLQGIISKDFTEAGVSMVNVIGTSFLRYSRIFLRQDEGNTINLPVSIVTDVDVRHYEKVPSVDDQGAIKKDDNGRVIYGYIPLPPQTIKDNSDAEEAKIRSDYEEQNVRAFVANNWTLEFALLKSDSLGAKFCEIFKNVHPQIDEAQCEQELAKKLIGKLKKTEIAYQLAATLETDDTLVIDENDESIKYLIDAIKNACNV